MPPLLPPSLVTARTLEWPPELLLQLPRWARHPSGLHLPTEAWDRNVAPMPPVPGIPAPDPKFGIVLRSPPSVLEQMHRSVEEGELGFSRTSTIDDHRRWCA